MAGRYAAGLPAFLRHPLSPSDCRRLIAEQLAARTGSFLDLVDRAVFRRAGSPYLPLFVSAGIGYPELKRLTTVYGVEEALEKLRDAGIWLSLEEFKGRKPIVRNGTSYPVNSEAFDNPLIESQFEGRTGGSRGPARRLLLDLDLLSHDAACHALHLEAFGLTGRPFGVWRPAPPDNSGIKKVLMQARLGRSVDRWFIQAPLRARGGDLKYFLFTWQTLLRCRLSGIPQASPEYTPLAQARVVASWLAEQCRAGRPAYLDTLVSSAVRVAQAATDAGLDIRGSFFRVGGEPLHAGQDSKFIGGAGCRVACPLLDVGTGPGRDGLRPRCRHR